MPLFLSSALWSAFLLMLLISATWLLGLMAVNSDIMVFHYLFAAFCCLEVGPNIWVFESADIFRHRILVYNPPSIFF